MRGELDKNNVSFQRARVLSVYVGKYCANNWGFTCACCKRGPKKHHIFQSNALPPHWCAHFGIEHLPHILQDVDCAKLTEEIIKKKYFASKNTAVLFLYSNSRINRKRGERIYLGLSTWGCDTYIHTHARAHVHTTLLCSERVTSVHISQMRFVGWTWGSSLRTISVAPKRPAFPTVDFHSITLEVSKWYSVLFDVASTQESRGEDMVYIQAPLRKLRLLHKISCLSHIEITFEHN